MEREQLDKKLEEIQAQITEWERLIQEPQFNRMVEMVEQKRRILLQELASLPSSLDDCIADVAKRGEIAGLQSAINYPELMVQELKQVRTEILEQIREDEENVQSI